MVCCPRGNIWENINPSVILSTRRHLQNLPEKCSSNNYEEIKSAVTEYCNDPDEWINNEKYALYG